MRKGIFLTNLFIFTCSLVSFCQNWQPLNGKPNFSVRVLYSDSDAGILYIGGHFTNIDGLPVNYIAQWNGSAWDSLGKGSYTPTCNIRTITKFQGAIYSYGCFSGDAPYLAKWDETSWDSIATAQNDVPNLKVIDNELYALGSFDSIAGTAAKDVAKWDGINWSAFSQDINSYWLWDCTKYKDTLYVCGNIRDDSLGIYHIAKWNGSEWTNVGEDFQYGTWINKIVVYNDELYAGGLYRKIDGCPGNSIAKWDGNGWSDVGGGVNGQIFDLIVYNGELYALGIFDLAGGVQATMIAKWDGIEWCGLGGIFDNAINTACIFNNELYVGGGFWTIDGDSTSYIAKWTGGSYVDTCGNSTGLNEQQFWREEVMVIPNPVVSVATVRLPEIVDAGTMGIIDILGKEVRTIYNISGREIRFSCDGLDEGIYFLYIRLKDGPSLWKARFVVY